MKIIEQSWSFEDVIDGDIVLNKIERAGRTCYKSEDKITVESAKTFVKAIMNKNHESVLEHVSMSVRIITDRGVTHEIVRHRIASYSQESTRYCNYSKDKFGNELTFICPVEIKTNCDLGYFNWIGAMQQAERFYLNMIKEGCPPQLARSVLPNSLKTEIVMTANLREWKHFFKLRTSPAAHPQMKALAKDMLEGFKRSIPIIFDDIV